MPAALPTPWPGAYTAPGVRTTQVAQGVVKFNAGAPTSGSVADTVALNEIAQVEKGLVWFNPSIAPFLRMLTKLKNPKSVPNPRFYHLEKQRLPRSATLDGVTGGATSPTGLSLGATEATRFRVNDLLYNTTTSDIALVTAITDDDDIVVTSNIGNDAPSGNLWVSGQKVINIGNAYLDGVGAGSPIHVIEDEKMFFCQIFKDSIEQSDRYQKTELYEGNSWTNARKQLEFEHLLSIEHAYFLGKPSVVRDAATGKLRFTMGGLKHYANVNQVDFGGDTTVTKAFMDSVYEEALRMGESGFENKEMANKTQYASQKWLRVLNTVAEAQIRIIEPSQKTFGLRIAQYQGSWGVVNLINAPVLNQPGLSGESYIVDLQHLRPANFKGRDTRFKGNIQANDLDGDKGTYISDKSLVVEVTPSHTRLFNLG
jgi:hypothetical protein